MMRRICALFLMCLASFLTACDDRDAQNYAKELIGVLDSYQTQVSEKVKAERNSYKELAAIYAKGSSRVAESALKQERRERSRKLTTDMIRSEYPPTSSDILTSLKEYGEQDFDSTRKLIELESDAQAQFLGDIEALEFDVETIAALRESLKDLAKPKGKLKQLRDVAVFVKESKTAFENLTCHDLKGEIADLEQQVVQWQTDADKNKGKINSLLALITELKDRQTAKGCQ
jgi:hypothetical protein